MKLATIKLYAERIWALIAHRLLWILAEISHPGQPLFGRLQAMLLRSISVDCPSNDVWIGARCSIDNPRYLHLGRRVSIGPDSRFTGHAHITIGDDFLGAPGLYANSGSHDLLTLAPEHSPITIGKAVWCGTRVTICSGVTIGDNAVVGACTLVRADIPKQVVAVGVPAKIVRDLSTQPAPPPEKSWSNFKRNREVTQR